ncbi:MAG: hypothetical protein Q7K48_05950 [Fusobacterium sp. JB021]|nr:hypothetical protein [Fusobacterium sp. JB020]MDP0493820.1 hypothetical protein [Fusobacterium sp. JB021]
MLKLLILTPENSKNYVKEALIGIEQKIEYIVYDDLQQLKNIYIEVAHKYDAVITSGPIGYEIITTNAKLITPVYYIEIDKYELYRCLFDVLRSNPNIDFSKVYIDFISSSDKKEWLEDTFTNEKEPIFCPLDYSSVELYDILKKNYLKLQQGKKVNLVITRISNMLKFLEEINMPYIFLFPSKNTIRNIVNSVIIDLKAKNSEKKEIILIKILVKKNITEVRKILANNFNGIISEPKKKEFEILTLKKDFYSYNIEKLLKNLSSFDINIGFGGGSSINLARIYAEKSYQKNIDSDGNVLCLVEENKITTLKTFIADEEDNLLIFEKLKEINITGKRALGLIEVFKANKALSIKDLANYLSTTERTAARILLKLESNNLAQHIIKKIPRGRPQKKYILTF